LKIKFELRKICDIHHFGEKIDILVDKS